MTAGPRRGGAGGGSPQRARGFVVAVLALAVLGACTSTPRSDGAESATGSPGVTLEGPQASAPGQSPTPGEPASEPGQATPSAATPTAAPVPADPLEPLERDRARAVPLDEEGEPRTGVVARVAEVAKVRGEASLPGEIAGDALQVTIELDNQDADDLDLTGVVVNLYTGAERVPAAPLTGPGAREFPATLASASTERAVFVFRVDDQDAELEIELDIADAPTIVIFAGRA